MTTAIIGGTVLVALAVWGLLFVGIADSHPAKVIVAVGAALMYYGVARTFPQEWGAAWVTVQEGMHSVDVSVLIIVANIVVVIALFEFARSFQRGR